LGFTITPSLQYSNTPGIVVAVDLVVIFINTLTYFSLQIYKSFGMVEVIIGGHHAKSKPI
jgi:hypothetical protein